MSDISANNKRIAKNTLVLYVRMLAMMVISIYTSRVILKSLGIEDYGIYNVVGGFVSMFTMISGSLNNAINRFLMFDIGKGDIEQLTKTFSSAVTIQMLLALIFFIIAETIGLWFLNYKMVIPESRILATNFVYQFSIISFMLSLITIPYNAIIIAREKMSIFAYMSILDVVGKLLIAWSTQYTPTDKLIFFSAIIMIFSLIMRLIYGIYCKRNFEECNFKFNFDKKRLKEMFSFAGWNVIGSVSAILRDQGGNILINLFYGPTVNAARAIASQVNNAITGFVHNFQTALTPQIIKNYASSNHEYMFALALKGARFSFYILFFLSLPFILNTDYILQLWLEEVPAHSALFVQLVLILAMFDCVANPFVTIALATGRIRNYQLIVGGLQMLNLPIAYICLRVGNFPEIVTIVAIFMALICMVARLIILKNMVALNIPRVCREVFLNTIIVGLLSSIVPYFVSNFNENNFTGFTINSIICFVSSSIVILYIGCKKEERIYVYKSITNKLKFTKYSGK